MKKENINWEKYSNPSIDLIFTQATKLLEESVKSYRETTNKCYAAFAVYSSIIAFCLNKLISTKLDFANIPYAITLFGCSICVAILYETLKPAQISLVGSQPKNLLIEYFENFDLEDQEREYKEQIIVGYNNALIENEAIVKLRSKHFIDSLTILLITLFLSFFFYFILYFAECK